MCDKKSFFKKYDIIIIITVILLALILLFLFGRNNKGSSASILINGQIIKTVSLNQNTSFNVKSEPYEYLIEVENGQIAIKEADCPDKTCRKHGFIKNDKDSIVCVPGKLSIIVNYDSNQVDAVTY